MPAPITEPEVVAALDDDLLAPARGAGEDDPGGSAVLAGLRAGITVRQLAGEAGDPDAVRREWARLQRRALARRGAYHAAFVRHCRATGASVPGETPAMEDGPDRGEVSWTWVLEDGDERRQVTVRVPRAALDDPAAGVRARRAVATAGLSELAPEALRDPASGRRHPRISLIVPFAGPAGPGGGAVGTGPPAGA